MSVFEELIAHLKNYSDLATIQKEFKDSSGIIEELCSYTLMCSRKIIDPDPDNYIQYGPDDATVIGLLIKQHKGLEQLIKHIIQELLMLHGLSSESTTRLISRCGI